MAFSQIRQYSKHNNALRLKFYFLRKALSTEQIPFTKMFPSGAHFTAESTEAMRIKFLAQGHSILMQSEFEQSIAISKNRHLTETINILQMYYTCKS